MPRRGESPDAAGPLIEALRTVATGRGACVLVHGPVGVGKTWTLDQAIRAAPSCGVQAVAAAGSQIERDDAFGVVIQILERLLPLMRERPELAAHERRLSELLFTPSWRVPAPTPDAGVAIRRAVSSAVIGVAQRQPLAIFVDDAQWSDAATLQCLEHLARRIQQSSLALILGARGREPATLPVGNEETSDAGVWTRLEIGPLPEAAVGRMLAELLGAPPDGGFVSACTKVTGGSPYLIRELVAEMRARGARPADVEPSSLERYASMALGHRSRRRIEDLPAPAGEVAFAVAVLESATPHEAAAVAGVDVAEALAAADALAGADVLRRSRRLTFQHPLVRAAVESAAPAGERALAHRRAARALSAHGASPSRVAAHLLRSDGHGEEWAVEALRAAARAATARGEPEIAAKLLRRAMREPPAPSTRPAVRLEQGAAEARAGSREAVAVLSRAYEELEDVGSGAVAAELLSIAYLHAGQTERAAQVLERAIGDIAPRDRHLALQLETTLLLAAMVDARGGELVRRRAEARLGDIPLDTPAGRRSGALWSYVATAIGCSRREAVALADRSLAGGRLLEECDAGDPAPYAALHALFVAERYAQVHDGFASLLAVCRARGTPLDEALTQGWTARVDLARGELGAAEHGARQALTLAMHDVPAAVALPASVILELLRLTGRLAEAERLLDEPVLAFAFTPVFVHHAEAMVARGRVRSQQDRPNEALDDFLAAGRLLEQHVFRNPAVLAWRSEAARALARLGRTGEALSLVDGEVDAAIAYGSSRAIANALAARGRIRGASAGTADLERAASLLIDSDARIDRARVLAELGASRRRDGQRTSAREALRQALDIAIATGATSLADEIHEELRVAGARPRRERSTGVEALTASERRVAGLAAAGRTNREIADHLVVTVKAVEWHLRNAYAKLGIQRRQDLTRALGARPEAPTDPATSPGRGSHEATRPGDAG